MWLLLPIAREDCWYMLQRNPLFSQTLVKIGRKEGSMETMHALLSDPAEF